MTTRALVADGSLVLSVHPAVWREVEPWIPRSAGELASPPPARATVRALPGQPERITPDGEPVLDLCGVLGWIDPEGTILLLGPHGEVSAVVRVADGEAVVRLAADRRRRPERAVEVLSVLLLASAFLLGRLGRTLVHAGAVVAPDGSAWLLAGGTFSGKSTTCVNLIRCGWDYLSDDQVILGYDKEGRLQVEGWPRRFNLDLGYHSGASRGERARVDPAGYGPGQWRRSAPLGGLIFPRVRAEDPTAFAALHPAGALARLVQQSPWLLADAGMARTLLALLQDAVRRPAFELFLGMDCYADLPRLEQVLKSLIGSAGRPPSVSC
jgi:hypothetical protein